MLSTYMHTDMPSYTHVHVHVTCVVAYTAYQTTFNSRVIDVLSEWGSLYVLLKDGRVRV